MPPARLGLEDLRLQAGLDHVGRERLERVETERPQRLRR
jgi:hypothetical protein